MDLCLLAQCPPAGLELRPEFTDRYSIQISRAALEHTAAVGLVRAYAS
jgi:hypothetical protein